jgi:hypothetical protein
VRKSDRRLALGLFVATVLVGQALFAEALGLTYDEPVYAAVGERHLAWWGRVLRADAGAWSRDGLERGWGNSGATPVEADWHPPLGKLWLALWGRCPSPCGPFARWRLGATLFFALTATALFCFLTPRAGRCAGLGAWLALVTMPRFVADGNLGALDGAVACLATLALCAAQRVLERPDRRRGVVYGVLLGAAMATKFNGILVAPAVLLVAGVRRRAALRPLALGTFVVAPLVFWLSWPWLWYDGLHHLRQVVAFHGRHGLIATSYFGTVYTQPPPPWHYAPVMLAVTTPLLTLASAALGVRRPLAGLLLAALACHLLPFLNPSAAKYNGVRLFLPVLPLLAALSGLGLAAVLAWVRARVKGGPCWVAPTLVALAVYLPAARGLLGVYPYPLAYYNALVGGPAGAERRGLEVSYWGDPFRGLVAWLSAHAPRGAEVYLHPPGAIAMVEMYRAVGLLRKDIRLVHGTEAARRAAFRVYQNRPSEWDELGRGLRARAAPRFVLTAAGAPVGFVWPGPGS